MIRVLSVYTKFLFYKGLARLNLKDEMSDEEVKLGSHSFVDYDENEALGMQIVPTIGFKNHVVAVIEETDDGEDLVRMDIKMNGRGMEGLMIRVEISEDDQIRVIYGFDLEKTLALHGEVLDEALVAVGGDRCFIGKEKILAIAKLMRCKKAYFGFSCDSEFGLCDDGKVVDFQTRLAPTILGVSEISEVKECIEIARSDFVLSQRFFVEKRLLKIENLYSLFHNNYEQLVEAIGDPSDYILLLDQPISRYISLLIRLATENGMYFAGIIDVNSGVDLTHSDILNGGTYFLRHNVPVVGRLENRAAFDLLQFDMVGDVEGKQLAASCGKVLMFSPDGRQASIAIEKIAA